MPGLRPGITYLPSPPVVAVRSADVDVFFAVTVAPGTTPPELSRTAPVIDPASACANAGLAEKHIVITIIEIIMTGMIFAIDRMRFSLSVFVAFSHLLQFHYSNRKS